jgi:hypothetical protein
MGFGDEHYPIDESISSDTHDFLEEGLVLLHGFQRESKIAALELKSYAEDQNDVQIKHLLLYNEIALIEKLLATLTEKPCSSRGPTISVTH